MMTIRILYAAQVSIVATSCRTTLQVFRSTVCSYSDVAVANRDPSDKPS